MVEVGRFQANEGRAFIAGALLLFAVSCGARTTLGTGGALVGDETPDANGQSCMQARASGTPAPAYVEIVLDASGSMADASKWPAASLAIHALVSEYAGKPDV